MCRVVLSVVMVRDLLQEAEGLLGGRIGTKLYIVQLIQQTLPHRHRHQTPQYKQT